MVHNKENYCSINYVEYINNMSHWNFKNLMKRYESDYWYNETRYPEKFRLMEHLDKMDKKKLFNFYDLKEFNPGWMLNISPNWKGVQINCEMIDFFIDVILKFYENCNRFINMKYVLENGHGKDHLHAHIVFTLNTKKPGYMTPIKKGHILTEFRNCWNRLAKERQLDWVDLVNARCALNTCLLTKECMYRDKLDYLCEELKPESHKNDEHQLCPIKGSNGF